MLQLQSHNMKHDTAIRELCEWAEGRLNGASPEIRLAVWSCMAVVLPTAAERNETRSDAVQLCRHLGRPVPAWAEQMEIV